VSRQWFSVFFLTITLQGILASAEAEAVTSQHITTAQTLSIPSHGYSAPPHDINNLRLPDEWVTVNLPHALTRQLVPPAVPQGESEAPTIETWYRLQLPTLASGEKIHHLYIPRWKTDGRLAIYGDGKLLYMSQGGIYWNGWNIPLRVPINATADTPSPNIILLRIQRPLDSGGGISSIWLQESTSLNWRYRVRYLLQVQLPYTSSVVFLAVGIFSFFVWRRLRSERSYLLFFFIAAASFIRTLHYYVGESPLPMSEACLVG
jgi:hypothetical protein